MVNLALPGNPRYQPKNLQAYFGYDNLVSHYMRVEIAAMRTLADMGIIPQAEISLLTPEVEAQILEISTTEVDVLERAVTKHDIRALVQLMQGRMPENLRKWVHIPLTSYDVIDSARSLMFLEAHRHVVRPRVMQVMDWMRSQAVRFAPTAQIGRSHGQQALPITVGFWWSTILSRVLTNLGEMDRSASMLVGKISGPVGAYNAQRVLGVIRPNELTFEQRLLQKLGLSPALISTQILPPEPLAYYLHAAFMLSGAFGQFGLDVRQLMRSEIAEIVEPFSEEQVGSSTMAHKRNPVVAEGLQSAFTKNIAEIMKVHLALLSEHQRDLTGSAVSRDFPTIIVNLMTQVDALLREDKETKRPFIARLTVDEVALQRNLSQIGDACMAEPLYILLQMNGYAGDAHHLVNHELMPLLKEGKAKSLMSALEMTFRHNLSLAEAWHRIPEALRAQLHDPQGYVGVAAHKVEQVSAVLDLYLKQMPALE